MQKLEVCWTDYDQPVQYNDGTVENFCIWLKNAEGRIANTGLRFEHKHQAEIAFDSMRTALRTAGMLLERDDDDQLILA